MLGSESNRAKIVGFHLTTKPTVEVAQNAITAENHAVEDDDRIGRKKSPAIFPTWYAAIIIGFVFAVFGLVVLADRQLPAPFTSQDAREHPGRFLEGRARTYLKQLTSLGPRTAGSYENEVLAVEYLKREVETIRENSSPVHKLSTDIQKPRGAFGLNFIDGLTHHYRDIQNFIVKLESTESTSANALLINCHFDSVPQSPGASDDAVSCAIMLEIMAVLTQSDEPLKHNVIFLFNGAEENMLPASHGFITQHKWASEVRAFINLEACGAGGREFVFQTGPHAPWMINAYGKVASYPFASVIGQEIFETGVVTADTDFRIFRDYGNVPGLDIAYMKNGYVYHTGYDQEDAIPPGSIQRAGDNFLEVVKYIANSEELAHPESQDNSNAVFFDFLGMFLVNYPESRGVVINLFCVALSLYTTYVRVNRSHEYGVDRSTFLTYLGYAFWYHVLGMIASFVTVILIATFLDALGHTMSWFARPYLILFLYISPTIFSVVAVFNFAIPRQKKVFAFVKGTWSLEALYFEASKLSWSFFCLVGTIFRVQSSFLSMLWVIFPTAGRMILDRLYEQGVQKKEKDITWLMIHLFSLIIPLLLNLTMIYATFIMFIPIMGRSGSAINPDLLIGCLTVAMTLATISYLCPLVMVIEKPSRVMTTLYLTTLITMALVCTTRLGFPYSAEKGNLAPHRAFVLHTEREIYDKRGEQIESDVGYWIVNLDRNSPQILLDHVPEMNAMQEVSKDQCQEYLFCGMPLYYPAASLLRYNNWIPASMPRLFRQTKLELLTTEDSGRLQKKLLFRVTGPDHMSVVFSPAAGVNLASWSFGDENIQPGPDWKDGRRTYFIFYSHGLTPKPWEFWIELNVTKTFLEGDDLVDVVTSGHFIHGSEMKTTAEFKRFISQYPSWSYVVGWTASVRIHRF